MIVTGASRGIGRAIAERLGREGASVAVLGATGAQGGGLVRAILSDLSGGFAARAITRDVNFDKAKELLRSAK